MKGLQSVLKAREEMGLVTADLALDEIVEQL